jgi:hypothetical protein
MLANACRLVILGCCNGLIVNLWAEVCLLMFYLSSQTVFRILDILLNVLQFACQRQSSTSCSVDCLGSGITDLLPTHFAVVAPG